MSDSAPIIVWFRQDLRLGDNPALHAAAERGVPILPLYILDRDAAGIWAQGGASKWWLHESLRRLHESTNESLRLFSGDALSILAKLSKAENVRSIYWNRCYEPWRIQRDERIESALLDNGIEAQTFNGSLLFEPPTIHKKDGLPYKVFTPFYQRGCLVKTSHIRPVYIKPGGIVWHKAKKKFDLDELDLVAAPRWHDKLEPHWIPGEKGAAKQFRDFVANGIEGYKEKRNLPAESHTSSLSPHLHFGEISPHQIWDDLKSLENDELAAEDVELFRRQIIWREFSYYLMYHWPKVCRENLQAKFDKFPWKDDAAALKAWQKGRTGYPIVDAGMRELWATGYMHNRVRMIVASFLVKNLLIHWHRGEDWFWDTLVDADLANNSVSWQWVAGSGADAAPYFRIFNPVTQGEKFDSDAEYVRRHIPELARMPNKWIHKPWQADSAILKEAKVALGETYPVPIVDLKASRERALEAFKTISGRGR